MKIHKFLVGVDKFCDFVPIVGTLSNLVNLFEKAVMKPPGHSSNAYKIHIAQKKHCAVLLIPIFGCIYVYFANKRENASNVGEDGQADIEAAVKACKEGNYDEMVLLFDQGLNPDIKIDRTPLIFHAAKHPTLVNLFIEKGANLNVKNTIGYTFFHFVLISSPCETSAGLVLDSNQIKDLDQHPKYGCPPLIRACELGWVGFAEELIAKGADVNIVSQAVHMGSPIQIASAYSTPLLYAIKTDNAELVDLLIKNGAIIDNEVSTDETIQPVHLACKQNPMNKDVMALLLNKIKILEPALAKIALEEACRQGNVDAFNLFVGKCNRADLEKHVPSLRKIIAYNPSGGRPQGEPWLIGDEIDELFPS